jgi:hypothetical protein
MRRSFSPHLPPIPGSTRTPTSRVVYPDYHRATDTWNNGLLNYDQIWKFGLANFACILEYALLIDDEALLRSPNPNSPKQ